MSAPVREYGLPKLEALRRASIRLADASAEDDDEYRRADAAWRKCLRLYVLSEAARMARREDRREVVHNQVDSPSQADS